MADRGTRRIAQELKPKTGKPKLLDISLYCCDDPDGIGAPVYMNGQSLPRFHIHHD